MITKLEFSYFMRDFKIGKNGLFTVYSEFTAD
jgi:hypothetical protein